MENNQPAFLLTISGNVLAKLQLDKAVLSASWEYRHKQTSVLVEAEVLETGEALKASLAIRKHFSMYGIVRSVHYCPRGVESALQLDRHTAKRTRVDGSRQAIY